MLLFKFLNCAVQIIENNFYYYRFKPYHNIQVIGKFSQNFSGFFEASVTTRELDGTETTGFGEESGEIKPGVGTTQ